MRKILPAFLATLFLLTSCGGRRAAPTVTALEDVNGKQIGAVLGTAGETYAGLYGTMHAYASFEAMLGDLSAGVIDCAFVDFLRAPPAVKLGRGIRALSEPLFSAPYQIAVALESRGLLQKLNAALSVLRENGTLALLTDKYILDKEITLPESAADGTNAALRLAVPETARPPYCVFSLDSMPLGLDIDLARLLCAYLGVSLEFVIVPEMQLLDAVRFGKADFAMGALTESEETRANVTFSDAYIVCEIGVLTRK